MQEQFKRRKFFNTSRYQRKSILLFMVPTIAVCLFISAMQSIFVQELMNVIINQSPAMVTKMILQANVYILIMLWTFFFLVIIWAVKVSEGMVGSFERVISELDQVINGERKISIRVRENDEMATQLLKRVNVLIEKFRT